MLKFKPGDKIRCLDESPPLFGKEFLKKDSIFIVTHHENLFVFLKETITGWNQGRFEFVKSLDDIFEEIKTQS